MTARDLVVISAGNLRRMKLRTFLTTSGVLIAIAAFVSMLSFGAGNQENIEREFNNLGLFSTMQVTPKASVNVPDTASSPKLDARAFERLAAIPGVNLVYPYDALSVKVRLGDSLVDSRAQALPLAAMHTKLFSRMLSGSAFVNDSSRQAVITEGLMKKAGIASPDSVPGRRLVLSVRVSSVDSALAHVLFDRGESLLDRVMRIRFDSLMHSRSRSRIIRTELNEAMRRFLNGYVNAQEVISDTLTVCGVRKDDRMGRLRIEPVIIPFATATRLAARGNISDPASVFASMSNGTLFSLPDDPGGKTFSQVTVDFDPKVPYKRIRDSVEAMGFTAFSFAAQFEEIQRVFLYFDLALGVIGLIALTTASLGIINTMVMSITERKREIGVLKSLGADERDIRRLFLVESGVIGVLGTAGGILFGWVITRIVSAIAQAYMKGEGMPVVDPFALPPWLILIALAVGIGVSVLAGFYPAARAARVDPVEALRND